MAKMEFEAEPYPLEFEPESTALLIIDMQRDFVEPGGFADKFTKALGTLPNVDPRSLVTHPGKSQEPHAK